MDSPSATEQVGDNSSGQPTPPTAPGGADDAMTSRFRSSRVLLMLVVLAFVVSTVPGVRSTGGYDLLLDGVLNNVAYEAAAALALLRVLALPRPVRSPSSFLLPLALGLYGLGNVYWTIFLRPLADQPFPSAADALFLSFYPLVFVVLMLKLRLRAPASLWLDGLVIGLALGALIAAVAIRPILEAGVGSWAAVITTAAYPLLDLVLLLMLTITLSMYRWRPPFGVWLLTAGLLIFIIADVVYLFATASGTYTSGGPVDGVWVLGVFSMALTPGWASRPTGLVLPTWTLLAVPLVSTLLALGLLVFDHVHPLHLAAVALAAATIVVALGRLMVTFRQVSSLSGSHELARTDELTGLGNRRALYDATPALLKERDPAGLVALMLLDLDRFKEVNDSLGHHAGDAVLCQVADRLAGFRVHDAELVVRLGGDEFALVLTEAAASETERVAEAIRAAVSEPMVVDGVVMRVDTSIGIAVLPSGAADLPVLLRQADVAMYRAKTQRLGSFAYRAEADEFASGDRLQTIERLRESIAQRRMVLHYQPKVDRLTGRATSVEALVRWQDPERGLLPPAAFLPLVEHSGLMPELTASVLEQALDQAAVWHAEGRELSVAVNLTAASLDDAGLPSRVAGMLTDRGLPGTALQIEITEDFLMGDHQRARAILSGLRQLGVRISVDDYGTGYSSLSYLRELPIDELKLDRSFLTHFVDDPRASAIVRSTIGLAHSLGLRLVAEGVEDATTSLELTEAGCDVQQGYYYAKPLPAEELGRWLDEDAPAPASTGQAGPAAAPSATPAAAPSSTAETSSEPA